MNFDRREMIGMLVALPAGLFLVRCGSTATNPSGPEPGAAPVSNGTQNVYTSSNSGGHVHTFAIDRTAITTPPAAGVAGPASVDSGHSHDVTVTMDQLQLVSTGSSVAVTTTTSGGHSHVFTFVKVA